VVLGALRGLSTKELAAERQLSPHTVGTHLRHVGVRSRRELASMLMTGPRKVPIHLTGGSRGGLVLGHPFRA